MKERKKRCRCVTQIDLKHQLQEKSNSYPLESDFADLKMAFFLILAILFTL